MMGRAEDFFFFCFHLAGRQKKKAETISESMTQPDHAHPKEAPGESDGYGVNGVHGLLHPLILQFMERQFFPFGVSYMRKSVKKVPILKPQSAISA